MLLTLLDLYSIFGFYIQYCQFNKELPFEPIHDIFLTLLFYKVAFLVAISLVQRVSELSALSFMQPCVILHKDKVVLRPSHLMRTLCYLSCAGHQFTPRRPLGIARMWLGPSGFTSQPQLLQGRQIPCLLFHKVLTEVHQLLNGFDRLLCKFVNWEVKCLGIPQYWCRYSLAFYYLGLCVCKTVSSWYGVYTFSKFYKVHVSASPDASFSQNIQFVVIFLVGLLHLCLFWYTHPSVLSAFEHHQILYLSSSCVP